MGAKRIKPFNEAYSTGAHDGLFVNSSKSLKTKFNSTDNPGPGSYILPSDFGRIVSPASKLSSNELKETHSRNHSELVKRPRRFNRDV